MFKNSDEDGLRARDPLDLIYTFQVPSTKHNGIPTWGIGKCPRGRIWG